MYVFTFAFVFGSSRVISVSVLVTAFALVILFFLSISCFMTRGEYLFWPIDIQFLFVEVLAQGCTCAYILSCQFL